jgi:rhodanese-related sulfurtransferase
MNNSVLLRAAPALFALAVTQVSGQVVADDACPKHAVDIAAFASCDSDRVARSAADEGSIAASKRSQSAQHLSAAEAYRLLNDPTERAALVDVRSGLELTMVGAPVGVAVHLPYAEPKLPLQWDSELQQWAMTGNQDFAGQLMNALAARGIGPDHTIIFIRRSGERSAHAADELADFGYTTATVVDGFEGDLGEDQRRSVNGWKNAGLPWTARIALAARPGG